MVVTLIYVREIRLDLPQSLALLFARLRSVTSSCVPTTSVSSPLALKTG